MESSLCHEQIGYGGSSQIIFIKHKMFVRVSFIEFFIEPFTLNPEPSGVPLYALHKGNF